MSRVRSAWLAGLATLVVGAAGWASRAELDEIVVDGARARLALVPSWPPFVAFAALAGVGLLGLAVLRHRAPAAARQTPLGQLVLPAFGLLLLVVPYLPVLPDWWPGLQALAGPGYWLVWALAAAQLVWTLAPLAPGLAAWWTRRSLRAQTLLVWLATAAAAGAGATRLTHTVLFPSGDEPHYLVIAQSLWRDGDLKIENNHVRKDYAEYFGRDLDPHYLTRGVDREIYSIHPVGMPVLITPIYALGGYDLVVAAFVAMAATAAALAWRWVVIATAAVGTTTLAWAAIALSTPFLLNAFTIYPEVPAALVVMLAITLTLRFAADRRAWHDVAIGLLAGLLPWFSTKYAPMSAALVAVALARRAWPMHAGESRGGLVAASVRVGAPYAASLLGWFAFFDAYWGKPLPSAPYGRMVQTEIANTLFGVPGLLFDQEYGLLAFAPAYLLAGAGFWTMLRRPGPLRRLGLEVLIVFLALIGTVGAFRIWWGGSAAPGRPITSGLALLMLPMAVQLGTAAPGSARRAAQHLLIWLGVSLTFVIVFAQGGLLINNDRDGTSSLLEWLSPRWPLWTLAPTFIAHEAWRALADSAVWLTVAAAASWGLARVRAGARGTAALAAWTTGLAALALGVSVVTAMPAHEPALPGIDLAARARLTALDTFDRAIRPWAVTYRPTAVRPAREVEGGFTLSVTPGQRTQPQPLRVLHNGRFSLPAGRYRLTIRWADRDPLPAQAGTPLMLQVGRTGSPLATWPVTPAPRGAFSEEVWLPVDAGFVGLRGSAELERSMAAIRFEAIDVVDAGRRTATPQVLAAAYYGEVMALFHDEPTYPERAGFWTTGARRTRVSLACPGGCTRGLVLHLHSGKRPNRVRLTTHGWTRELALQGETPAPVTIPPPADGGVITLDIDAISGFVPAVVDPSTPDQRFLGAWVEVVGPPKEPTP